MELTDVLKKIKSQEDAKKKEMEKHNAMAERERIKREQQESDSHAAIALKK